MAALEQLVVGDVVALLEGSFRATVRRVVVHRVTATRVIVRDGAREYTFVRASGRLVGESGYHPPRIEPWAPRHDALVAECEARELRDWFRSADLSAVPLDTLRAAAALLQAHGPTVTATP